MNATSLSGQNAESTDQPLLVLNHASLVPFYEQIAQQVRTLIMEKRLKPGQVFFPEGVLARKLGISKMPVRQAFEKLRSEGLLVIGRGKKPVIGPGPVAWNFQELRGFSEEMRNRGLVPSAKLLEMGLQIADSRIINALGISAGARVYRMKRLRFANNEPVALVTSYLPAQLFPELDKQDLESLSLYYVFEHIYGRKLLRAQEFIGAVTAGREEAHILQTVVGSALLHIEETAFDIHHIALEHSISLLRGDRYTASVVSVRRS